MVAPGASFSPTPAWWPSNPPPSPSPPLPPGRSWRAAACRACPAARLCPALRHMTRGPGPAASSATGSSRVGGSGGAAGRCAVCAPQCRDIPIEPCPKLRPPLAAAEPPWQGPLGSVVQTSSPLLAPLPAGLRPQEYYFHCMAGREGLVDTTVKTSRSGGAPPHPCTPRRGALLTCCRRRKRRRSRLVAPAASCRLL